MQVSRNRKKSKRSPANKKVINNQTSADLTLIFFSCKYIQELITSAFSVTSTSSESIYLLIIAKPTKTKIKAKQDCLYE